MKLSPLLEKSRVLTGEFWSNPGDKEGAFYVPGPFNNELKVLASSGSEEIQWEHVSVSLPNRCPNWMEMCFIKSLFFDKEETVIQLHPPESEYINNHPFCLHLWRPLKEKIPLPPRICV